MTSKILILSLSLTLLFSACGGGSSDISEGTDVAVRAMLEPQNIEPQANGSKTFVNSEGRAIRIHRGYLVIWSLKLESQCDEPSYVRLMDVFFGRAYAHAAVSPLVMPVPNVISLTVQDGQGLELGSLSPPIGDYCGSRIDLLRADDDTQNLPADVNMIDKVVYLEGEYRVSEASDWEPFVIESSRSLLPAHRLFPLTLRLSEDQRSSRIDIGIDYSRWFDGLDLSQLEDTTQIDLLLSNISSSISYTNN